MKIVVLQTAFIGDVILSTAIAEKIAEHHPDAVIDYVVRKGNESLLENNPHIRKVHVWNKKAGKYKNLGSIAKALRKEKYDHLINLQRFFSSGYLSMRSGAREKRGFKKNPLSFVYNHSFAHNIGDGSHEIDRNQQLIADLTDPQPAMPRLYPSTEDKKHVETYAEKPFVTMSPASVWFTKQWPAEKWTQLINRLQDYNVYLLGGPGDTVLCESIKSKSQHQGVEVLAGELSFLQSAALMDRASMNYSNDSAPLHIASAMDAPVTAIFCSTIPEFGFGPLSQSSTIKETPEKLDCRPCGLHGKKACPLGHFNCAHQIDPDQFVTSFEESR